MPAEVESMFYTSNERNGRFKPWHGLGVAVEEAPDSKKAIELAGLNWEVVQHDVQDGNSGIIVPDYKLNVRSSDNQVLGVVKSRYKIVQNSEAFDFTDNLVGNGTKYETAGSLFGGKKVWLLARMPVKKLLDDDVDPYIVFTNTHDGSGAIKAAMTPTRVVCNNTLNIALSNASRAWSTKHIGDINGKLAEAKETLRLADEYFTSLAKEAEVLAAKKISDKDVRTIIDSLFPVTPKTSDKQKENIQEQKDAIYVTMLAPDLANYAGTGWQLVNAVADYVDHHKPQKMTNSYYENNWNNIMNGHKILDQTYSMVSDLV